MRRAHFCKNTVLFSDAFLIGFCLFSVTQRATIIMIKTWRHKGLKLFYETGSTVRVQSKHANKLHTILQALDFATAPEQMNFPGLNFHPLTGDLKGFYSVKVNANWRVIFAFDGNDAILVDYIDYH